MKDASLVLKDAVIAALQADAALVALNGGRVFDDIPPPPEPGDYPEPSFTAVKVVDTTPWGNDRYRGSEVNLQIDSFVTASDDEPDHHRNALKMNVAICDALWGTSTISVAPDSPGEWILHAVWIDQTRVIDDPLSTAVAHGIVLVRANITPALDDLGNPA